jgi:probable F420-dependent oxidoreductase
VIPVGLVIFPTDDGIHPAELARAAEDAGFESLFVTEHTHIPVSRETPYPQGGDLPEKYWHTHDPFVALSFAAAATTRLKVGTAVCLVIEHDPIVLAKQVSSLDALSGGRVVFGVGAGWNREEMRNHGTDPERRFGIMRERVQAMRAIWIDDEASYHGRHVDFDPIWQWPKPLQDPHVPVLIGGNGPNVLNRVLRFGDGWMPNSPDLDDMERRIGELRERAGRRVHVTYYGAKPETLARIEAMGADRALFVLESGPRDAVLAELDGLAASIPSLQ